MEENGAEKENQEIRLERKSKILFLTLGTLIILSVGVTFYRYIVRRDYIIQAQVDCDPETENCLVWRCDPSSTEEGEACMGAPENDIWYYKILNRNAKNIPDCDPAEEACTAYQCEPGEAACEMTSCEPENAPENEECSAPEQYLKENPPEEESQCEEDDEECVLEQECDAEDAECPTSEEECTSNNEECLDAQSAECDPESEDCTEPSSEECAPGDESCASDASSESAPADSSVETPANSANF